MSAAVLGKVIPADPNLRDPETGLTPLELCRKSRTEGNDTSGHAEVEAILAPVHGGGSPSAPA